MKKASILLFGILLMSLISHSITYYVSPLGNDVNTGTSTGAPWKTISKVNLKDFKGDTILFQGGSTFPGSLYFTATDIGTSTKPIVIGSYGTGRATINSDTLFGIYIYNSAGFIIKDLIVSGVNRLTNKKPGISIYMDIPNKWLSFLRLNNLDISGYREAGISIGSWATAGGFKDISITNCISHDNGMAGISTFAMQPYIQRNVYLGYNKVYNNSGIAELTTGNSGSGISLGGVDVAVVEYCTSYNNGWLHKSADGGPVGIWAHASDSVTFQFNESHHNKTGTTKDGGGFDFDGGCTNSVMQYNYSHDNYGGGYLVAQYNGAPLMKNITIRYNISENDGRKGDQGSIHMWASSTSGGIQTVKIYNNTIFVKPSTGATPKGFYIRSGPITDVKLRNNILQTTGGVPLIQVTYNTSACTMQGNSYWSSGSTFKITWGATTYSSLTSWRSATGQEKINGVASGLQTDAQFADTTQGVTFNDPTNLTTLKRYKLLSTSALINKGLNLKTQFNINIGSQDYWGNSLVNKTTFHIGAFQGTPITTTASQSTLNEITARDNNIEMNLALSANPESQFKKDVLHVSSVPGQNNLVINFALAKQGRASIAIFNIQGQLITRVFAGDSNPGEYKQLKVENDRLTNGIYLVSMQVNGKVITKKILLSK
ncbi:T9SS type A sorting domain-containing protein [Chitinophagaceae bacterium LB-8]|uniref:T9SS type A sorting domain-containing protein n=1 Tax=Paraflavisolibacter caeni TaxID=2982496 RepID=A0A9X2XXY5_9BACT|nr:T9SS type A sorting domain-containing protein [Paraflavisolibacter caeni]MCU7550622.1 T9SS type A sorting domain-containing protein [Paraflavisolibacter caeni]